MNHSWRTAEFSDRQHLQSFICAVHPYSKAKRFSPEKQRREGIWASKVQTLARGLEPRYIEPEFLELAVAEGTAISALFYCKDLSWDNRVLRVLLGVVAVSLDQQGKQLGEKSIQRFLDQVGQRARAFGCKSVEVTASVHQWNRNCQVMLERLGWTNIGKGSEDEPDCDIWIVKGTAEQEYTEDYVELPLPLVQSTPEDAYRAFFPDGPPSTSTPQGVTFLWLDALFTDRPDIKSLRKLTYSLKAWGKVENIREKLDGYGVAQTVHYNDEDPKIAYVRLLPTGKAGAFKSFGSVTVSDYIILTLVQVARGKWKMWGLSERRTPTADEVRGRNA